MAGFSIVTNVNSLIAQDNLGKTNFTQQRTIERLTSGLRINSSADDAAGLAVANRFRSDIAVLQQGVRNAADGLSALQTIDGGLNNVSLLLDRGRTLATQSASGTFTGDRNTLNSEFQSVIEEINRQAQAIGLDPGGQFNAALKVFIGGGRANNGISETANGAVSIDLSNSAVNANRLGLAGVRALGGTEGTTDIGNSSSTNIENILADVTNSASVATAGFTEFDFSGPGFSDEGSATLAVNLSGVVDTSTLTAAINSAIAGFTAASAAGESFKNAEIQAVINTDTTGKQQLAFTSSNAAFQVQAGDQLANALLGNFDSGGPAGASLDVTRTGAVSATTAAAADVISVVVNGGGLQSPQTVSYTATIGDDQATVVAGLQAAIAANTTLSNAGFSVTEDGLGQASFTNGNGESFQVRVVGDASNVLGFGAAELGDSAEATYNTITTAFTAPAAGSTADFRILLEGAETAQTLSITVASAATIQDTVDEINAAIANNTTLSGAGFIAQVSGTDIVFETTTNGGGGNFVISVNDDDTNPLTDFTDVGATGVVLDAGTLGEGTGLVESTILSGGAQSTGAALADPIEFSSLFNGNDVQNLVVTAQNDAGAVNSVNINLTNANALTIDQAVNAINDSLQASNDTTLQKIVAVKERSGTGTEGIRFIANLPQGFSVGVGDLANNHGVANDTGAGDVLLQSSANLAGGSVADISSRENAEIAVSLLASAVSKLGTLQANVGRGQNRLQFAIGLATTQITNLSAAESRIRDADLATEAANLTRTSIAQQAGVAALAQANSAPQAVLALLRG
ncbi:MAG: flagellin [Acidobacteria bacterium]|nr:flagellin [Acidobacteriota bacterium]MDA1236910.1 flagellin [Acidobacteriota bacterium]